MKRQDFSYELPDHLIAKQPLDNRSASRLLVLDGPTGETRDRRFTDVLDLVVPGDLMVFNDTRVIPARIFAHKDTGGQVEILIERVLDRHKVLAQVRASKSPKPGSELVLADGTRLSVITRQREMFELGFPPDQAALETIETQGRMPLPPYIDRSEEPHDRDRYQTVYGVNRGAVAAPTAGLHFDSPLLQALKDKGVNTAFVTLHVGAGTFQPVRADDIRQHAMHSEVMALSQAVCDQVKATHAAGGRVIAVGTTSVRCLETAARSGEIQPYQGDTNIFIYPSYQFKVVDSLITNFHLPESTLLMLVCAFAGYGHTMAAYRHAVAQEYRFFSYGDAMLVNRNPDAAAEWPARSDTQST